MHEPPTTFAEHRLPACAFRKPTLATIPLSIHEACFGKLTAWWLRLRSNRACGTSLPIRKHSSLVAVCILGMTLGSLVQAAELLASHQTKLPGYLPAESKLIPEHVRIAARSVYRILVQTDTDLPFKLYDMVETEAYLTDLCTDPVDVVTQRNCQFMGACFAQAGYPATRFGWVRRQRATERGCYVPINDGGTVFVGNRQGDYVDLVTSWHVVDARNAIVMAFVGNSIKMYPAAKRVELLKYLSLEFTLLDQRGKEVLHVSQEEATIQSIGDVVGPLATRDPAVAAVGQTMEDFVAIRIRDNGKLGAPLEAFSGKIQEGDKAYAIGYPTRTSGRSHNSDGFRQFVSPGSYISLDTFLIRFQRFGPGESHSGHITPASHKSSVNVPPKQRFPFPYQLPRRRHVYFDSDVIQGNSGGPTVTATGEVVGIVTHSFSATDRYSPSGGFALSYRHLTPLLFAQ